MKITEHFWRTEFDCKDGTPYPAIWIQERLVPLCVELEKIRAQACAIVGFDTPLVITSGYRTPEHNARVHGKARSLHTRGHAADFYVPAMNPVGLNALHKWIVHSIEGRTLTQGGVGWYTKGLLRIHYDTRGNYVAWSDKMQLPE